MSPTKLYIISAHTWQSSNPSRGVKTADDGFDKLRVFLLGLGHFTVDVYANLLPPLLPIFKEMYGLSYAATAGLTSMFAVTSTLIQPIFGFIADSYGKKWIAAMGVAWISILMCLLGVAPGYAAIVAIVAFAGVGSAMFHPQGAAMVPKVSGDHKGVGVSIFAAGGSIGYSLMPLFAVMIVGWFGLHSLPLLIGPGLIVSYLLYRYAPDMEEDCAKNRVDLGEMLRCMGQVKVPLGILVTVVSLRSWICTGMITFIPLYFALHFKGWTFMGADLTYAAPGITLFIFLIANAIGGIIGGWASDHYGKKEVLVASFFGSIPFFYLAFTSPDLLVWPFMAIAGGFIYAAFPSTVLQAQELLPKTQGMAGGLILGFANGVGGLLVLLTGVISDHFGIFNGVLSLILITVVAAFLSLAVPGDKALKMEQEQSSWN
ncbi:MFS transporter [Methanocella conradii]|uniref:MFS transporter n=1 Tax=Methanocella conradii TaxID=1175444 RepID=UPI00157DCB8D|nr:MFS transporter [Methanocella conradii]